MYLFALTVTLIVTSCGQKKGGRYSPRATCENRHRKFTVGNTQRLFRHGGSGGICETGISCQRTNHRLPVVEGQRVRKGQLIAAIDAGYFPAICRRQGCL